MTLAQHSHQTHEHYTPEWLVEAARATLGEIDLDPASCGFANELVKARDFFDHRGLEFTWIENGMVPTRVFVNPPGKVSGKRGGQAIWWRKACDEFAAGNALAIVFVAFSVELLQTAQNQGCAHPLDFPVCFPRRRVAYDRKVDGSRVAGTSPPHASMIVCVTGDAQIKRLFRDAFQQFGYIHMPAYAFVQPARCPEHGCEQSKCQTQYHARSRT